MPETIIAQKHFIEKNKESLLEEMNKLSRFPQEIKSRVEFILLDYQHLVETLELQIKELDSGEK